MKLPETLHIACKALGLTLTPVQEERLLGYVDLLSRWNKAFNLTGVREPEAMISHHLADSLAVLPYLYGDSVLDVGSGAGLPGIPLAIATDACGFTLLDSNGKKTRFLRQVVMELKLERVEIVKSRIEQYRPPQPFGTVISRAFATLAQFAKTSIRFCDPATRLLAMKGRRPDAELRVLPPHVTIEAIVPLRIPGLSAQRHLICMRTAGTNENK